MVTIIQRPLTLTPVNVEHVYTFNSTNSSNTDFRYVVDLYVDTTTANPEKVCRLLVSPNTSGRGTIKVEEIVKNYVKGNARSEYPQYTSQSTTGNTAYGLLTNTKGISPSNAFNDDSNYPTEVHVRDYRIMVGEQYNNGTSVVTYISTDTDTPGSTFYAQAGGDLFRDINWYGAGANFPEGSTLLQGVAWQWIDSGAGLKDSAIDTNVDGSVPFTASTIAVGDNLTIYERYSGIIYTFTAYAAGGVYEAIHWELTEIEYPENQYDPVLSPPAVTIWPGTSLKEGSYNPYVYNTPYWDTAAPGEQQDFWEVKKYRMSGTTINDAEPSLFLTTAGESSFNVSSNDVGLTTDRARRRRHHPSCPILISFFNGILSQNTDFSFVNPIGCLTSVESFSQSTDYAFTGLTEYDLSGNTYTGLTPQSNRIMYFNTIRPDLAGGKIGFWTSLDVGEYQYDGYAFSEFLEYYLEEDDCLSDPVHVLFLNRQGVWDTYTLDRKALEVKSIKRDTYDKGGVTDNPIYSQLSTSRRTTIYNQEIKEVMSVNTWYLTDNDRQILEDLFMSPEVYIILEHDWTGKSEKTYNPYLLPVTLRTDSITEYKNRYTKLAQYSFNLEYSPINQYKTQG